MSLSHKKKLFTTIISKRETEKAYREMENSIYTLNISVNSSKTEVKTAVETLYPGVTVVSVNTINRKGKVKRNKFGLYKKKNTKIALVRLSGELEKFQDLKINIENFVNGGKNV
jgi:large subunit ribosomal protein L23